MAPVYLVTGSSRGLGLEIVRQLLKQEGPECPTVVACARNLDTAAGLKELLVQHKHDGRLLLLQLDVDDKGSCQAGADWVASNVGRLDVLINNAGVCEDQLTPWEDIDLIKAGTMLHTNVVGPLLVSSAMLPIMRKGGCKVIAHMSSMSGSVTTKAEEVRKTVQEAASGIDVPHVQADFGIMYPASKAALNMGHGVIHILKVEVLCTTYAAALVMAKHLAGEGFAVVLLDPGWVGTDMGQRVADALGVTLSVGVEQSVQGLLSVLQRVTAADSATFTGWDGKPRPL